MPFTTDIVPMPRWSTPVGCAKLALSLLVLCLVAASCAIWGAYAAFVVPLFTASLSMVVFAYYLVALSFRPSAYNKWIVLSLEGMLMLLWFISFIVISGWLATLHSTSYGYWIEQQRIQNLHPTSTAGGLYQVARSLHLRNSPLDDMEGTIDPILPVTVIRIHGSSARETGRILAGIAAGFAGVTFILYAVTVARFAYGIGKQHRGPIANTQAGVDVESTAQSEPEMVARSLTAASQLQAGSPVPASLSTPLRVDTLPKDFDPLPQTAEHYLTPHDAAAAGIEPPTPVLKAQIAEKAKGKAPVRESDASSEKPSSSLATLPDESTDLKI